MPRPCTCERIVKGQPWGDEFDQHCWDCWRYWHLAEHNLALGGDGVTIPWLPAVATPVHFDPPPPLDLTPRSSRAVVTAVTGDKGRDIFDISGPLLRRYAERCGADFVLLTPPHNVRFPLASKWHVASVLEHYERIAFLDADIIVRESVPNIFDATDPAKFAACCELPEILRDYPGMIEQYQQARLGQQMPRATVTRYINSGVYVASRQHREALATPQHACRVTHCIEQDYLNARLQYLNTPVQILPAKFNYQWWTNRNFDAAPGDAILHFSAMWDYAERLAAMKKFAG